MSTRPQLPLGPDSPTTEKDRTMDDEAKKRIRRLEGQLIAQRAFIGLALANPTRDHVEAVFETPALVKFYVDEPETSEIPKIVAEGFAYEKSRLKHHYDSFKDAYADGANPSENVLRLRGAIACIEAHFTLFFFVLAKENLTELTKIAESIKKADYSGEIASRPAAFKVGFNQTKEYISSNLMEIIEGWDSLGGKR